MLPSEEAATGTAAADAEVALRAVDDAPAAFQPNPPALEPDAALAGAALAALATDAGALKPLVAPPAERGGARRVAVAGVARALALTLALPRRAFLAAGGALVRSGVAVPARLDRAEELRGGRLEVLEPERMRVRCGVSTNVSV